MLTELINDSYSSGNFSLKCIKILKICLERPIMCVHVYNIYVHVKAKYMCVFIYLFRVGPFQGHHHSLKK